jgi:MFS family permease
VARGATTRPARSSPGWRTHDVWAIAGSAFFADLGYQAVLAGFPLFLVVALHQPTWEYGLASALSYGGGALFSYAGGRLGDRIGNRRLALAGNTVIPLLSLSALVASPAWAIGLLTGGWWARNLRSPSRRAMLAEAVPVGSERPAAFGFLHALDVGGGALAGVGVLLAVLDHVAFKWIFLATALPLAISTLTLSRTSVGRQSTPRAPSASTASGAPTTDGAGSSAQSATSEPGARERDAPGRDAQGQRVVARSSGADRRGRRALLAAATLYGFTFYSAGFPVLTVAQSSGHLADGLVAFLLLQASSAATGYLLGGRWRTGISRQFTRLGLLGYLGTAVGAGLIALADGEHLGLGVLLLGVVGVGVALGVVESLEPATISTLGVDGSSGRSFGALSAARSIGTFVGNLAMGLLYTIGAYAAYGYAAAVALGAAVVVLAAVPTLRRQEQDARGCDPTVTA